METKKSHLPVSFLRLPRDDMRGHDVTPEPQNRYSGNGLTLRLCSRFGGLDRPVPPMMQKESSGAWPFPPSSRFRCAMGDL
jgi:hypothetical protein